MLCSSGWYLFTAILESMQQHEFSNGIFCLTTAFFLEEKGASTQISRQEGGRQIWKCVQKNLCNLGQAS